VEYAADDERNADEAEDETADGPEPIRRVVGRRLRDGFVDRLAEAVADVLLERPLRLVEFLGALVEFAFALLDGRLPVVQFRLTLLYPLGPGIEFRLALVELLASAP